MDLLVTIVQITKDLLGSLNPLRLFRRDYRITFHNLWKQGSLVSRVGYVLGILVFFLLLAVAAVAVGGRINW
jgi:hypothetical protein